MDVPSPVAGRLRDLKVHAGDKVSEGDLIAIVVTDESASSPAENGAPAQKPESVQAVERPVSAPPAAKTGAGEPATGLPGIDEKAFSQAHASPSVRKFARELGADLGRIKGTGQKSRVTRDDVKSWITRSIGNDDLEVSVVGDFDIESTIKYPNRFRISDFGRLRI